MDSQAFEKLGAFYLGKKYDLEGGRLLDELLLYDSKDLTTHAVCVGMTGSGKTGLCLSLLEEAIVDGVPVLAIDPKGDLGNLMLAFPDLRPDDFLPWVDEGSATRKGMTTEEYAKHTARTWKDGLASWGQSGARIQKYLEAGEAAIYTPGSNAGLPLTVLKSFDAPNESVLADGEALRERVSAATSGLLALLGIDADPVQSREFILISNILDQAWRAGQSLDIARLIQAIQSPPFEKVGIFDLDTFFPSKDRLALAMKLNNLLASPSFAQWMEGQPLNIKDLLYTKEGKPRLAIISISHLSDAERMFFVTILLNEIWTWVRSQPGTTSLRALLYMDEVFGYFPPTANPPSKQPMLTLLKQARAFGLGVVLATQNPVDLDYKGLSNTGTWFLGRLQTERDKMRVLEGLEGAAAQTGTQFDRQRMEAVLAGLGSRVFLMNNVHDDGPVVFHTRWAMSYLRGPMTRQQIQTLMSERREQVTSAPFAGTASAAEPVVDSQESLPPLIPDGVPCLYLPRTRDATGSAKIVYRPALIGTAQMHFVRSTWKIDDWIDVNVISMIDGKLDATPWSESHVSSVEDLEFFEDAEEDQTYAELPSGLSSAKQFEAIGKKLKTHLYQSQTMTLWKCAALKLYSEPGESEGDFRSRIRHQAHELRDLKIEKLRSKYASKLNTLERRLKSAEERVAREKQQASRASYNSVLSIGSSIIGALFGRKLASVSNVGKATTSLRSIGRAREQSADVALAEDRVEDVAAEIKELETQFEAETTELQEQYEVDALELEALEVRPRKSDTQIHQVGLLWTPWVVSATGIAEPAFELET